MTVSEPKTQHPSDNRIQMIALDIYGTCLLAKYRVENPYRTLIAAATAHTISPEIMADLRQTIMTQPTSLEQTVALMDQKGLIKINTQDMAYHLKHASDLLDMHIDNGYRRNPELDILLEMTKENALDVALVSDLAQPYGQIADRYLDDISTRLYSYQTGALKEHKTPFLELSQRTQKPLSTIMMIGDRFASDVAPPQALGMLGCWYTPGKSSADHNNITALHDALHHARKRGYHIG